MRKVIVICTQETPDAYRSHRGPSAGRKRSADEFIRAALCCP